MQISGHIAVIEDWKNGLLQLLTQERGGLVDKNGQKNHVKKENIFLERIEVTPHTSSNHQLVSN